MFRKKTIISAFKKPVILVFLLFLSISIFAYTWILPGSERLTSSFGEFRTGHFHAGIDLSTPKGTGMRIVAPYEGDVVRVSIQPWGYGLALYYRSADDIVTVYGHLSSFNDEIQQRVEKEQIRTQSYSHDIWFQKGEYHYMPGQVLARSGDTGAGTAHLHFETRNGMARAINPFHNGFTVDDNMPPKFQGLLVIPQDRRSTVRHKSSMGIYGYLNLNPKMISAGNYTIDDTIYVSSSIGFAVRAFDYQRSSNLNRLGFYKISLYEDDALYYYAKYDSFEYSDTRQIGHVFDLFSENWGHSRYHRLFHREFIDAHPFELNNPEGGIMTPRTDEVRNFRIVAEDFYGNKSTLRFTVKGVEFSSSQDFSLGLYDWGGAVFYPSYIKRENLTLLLSRDRGKSFEAIPIGEGPDYMSFRAGTGDIAKLVHSERGGTNRSYFYRIPEKSEFYKKKPSNYNTKLHADENFLFITFKSDEFIGYPKDLLVNMDFEYEFHTPNMYTLNMRIPLNDLETGDYEIFITMFDGRVENITFTSFDLSRAGSEFYNGEFAIELPRNGLFARNSRMILAKDSTDWMLHPASLMFQKNASLWQKVENSNLPAGKLCFVRKWAGKEYFMDNDIKTRGGLSFITASTSTPGRFSTAVDTLPPEISNVYIGNTIVRFDVKDDLSGFDKKTLPEVYIDGIWTICTYDPEKDKCIARLPDNLTHATHKLKIIAEDICGNRQEVERNFNR
ncbi:MAG: M23 family metallopeptidase [Candidatus Zixiibacteriota bacterium]